jgi:hypothetical protein
MRGNWELDGQAQLTQRVVENRNDEVHHCYHEKS